MSVQPKLLGNVLGQVELPGTRVEQPERRPSKGLPLKPRRLATVYECDSNLYPVRALRAFAEDPNSDDFSPMILSGPLGVGKTLLLALAAQEMEQQGLKVERLDAEWFMNRFTGALRTDRMPLFRETYRFNVDVLIIDAFEYFEGGSKTKTYEELESTLRFLVDGPRRSSRGDQGQPQNHGPRRVILAGNVPLHRSCLPERLKSVLSGGLSIEIPEPTRDELFGFIQWLEQRSDVRFGSDAIWQLLEGCSPSFRDAYGRFRTVLSRFRLSPAGKVVPELVHDAFKNTTVSRSPRELVDHVVSVATQRLGVKKEDIRSKKRGQSISMCRQAVWYVVREFVNPQPSFSNIGKWVGGHHHSTVMHGHEKVQDMLELQNPNTEERVIIDFVRRMQRTL